MRRSPARAYQLRERGWTWPAINEDLWGDAPFRTPPAFYAAKRFAQENGLRWPVRPPVLANYGQDAYEMRERTGKPWGWISMRSRSYSGEVPRSPSPDRVISAACRWAQRQGLPWPVPTPPAGPSNGEVAYRRRLDGARWKTLTYDLYGGGERDRAFHAARRYARRTGLPWPLPVPPEADLTLPARVHALREEGVSWQEIGERLYSHHKRPHKSARSADWRYRQNLK